MNNETCKMSVICKNRFNKTMSSEANQHTLKRGDEMFTRLAKAIRGQLLLHQLILK